MYNLTTTEQMAMAMQGQVPDGRINWREADWWPLKGSSSLHQRWSARGSATNKKKMKNIILVLE